MIEDRYRSHQTPRTLQRVRRPAPGGTKNTGLYVGGGIVAGLLVVMLVAMSPRATVQKAGGDGGVNPEPVRVSDAPAPVSTASVSAPTETVSPATPKAQQKEAPPPVQAETKPVAVPEPVVASKPPTKEAVEKAPARPPVLFPSSGIGPLSKFIAGPDGQEGKADEIVRVTVDSLKITKSNSGKMGYSLALRKTRVLKGKAMEEGESETLTIDAPSGDPGKELGLNPATATGKTMVLFLKNEAGGYFSFFGLTDEDYERIKTKVTADAR